MKNMASGTTPRQLEVLRAIKTYIVESGGRSPTVRQLAVRLKIRSPNGVTDHLRALERKELIMIARPADTRGVYTVKITFTAAGIEATNNAVQ